MERTRLIALIAALGISGCDSRVLPVTSEVGSPSEPDGVELAFCTGPPKVAVDFGDPFTPESVRAYWTVSSGPVGPVNTRVWVSLHKGSSMYEGAQVSICLTASRPAVEGQPSTIQVHAPNIRIPPVDQL